MKNRHHIVEASVPGLADFARVSLDKCQEALAVLEAPDPYSRSREHDGRRIRAIDGGWLILNGEKYREKMNADERRESNRIYQARYRAKRNSLKNGKPLPGELAYEATGDERVIDGALPS